ncbi:GumC family protein [Pontibacter fetidus]|uniref:Polysaccharide biosynthesis tyrosine autokinase n=1 Tax=Pontibacter fetidus TaxID=2700082 RepID=A0A6B2H510_9BACT|nr:tyrosine-protein kinase [Pontibacter fetidus]NDK57503.1 polysaccharide biosynthesis tyrosine autokinase [Pontibacter fetidus]
MTEKDFFQFEAEAEEIDIKAIAAKYLRYWYLFVLGVIVFGLVAFLYLRYSTPQYSISATLLIKDDKKGPDLADNAIFSDLDIFNSKKNIDNEIEVLKSKSLMQRVLSELSMHTSFYREGHIKKTEIYGREVPVKLIISKLDSSAFSKSVILRLQGNNNFELEDEEGNTSKHQFGKEINNSYGIFTVVASTEANSTSLNEIIVHFHDIRKLADGYNANLKVEPVNKNASVLTLTLVSPVPEKGKAIINKLIEVYNKEAVEDKNLIAGNTIVFIDERLNFLTTELSDVEKDVEQYKRKNELTDVSSEAKLYMERASEYNKQLAEFEIQIDVLNSLEAYLKKSNTQFELVPSTLNIQDPTLLGLTARFNEFQLERERMLRTTTPNNPLVLNINDQLANLRVNILENLGNIKRGLTITKNNLQASSSQFQSRINQVPSIERELLEINRQQGIKEGLYLYLLQKREESALSLAASVSNSRVIDPAIATDNPISPKKSITYLVALLLGLGIPFAGIYIKDLLNDKVQEQKDVERATKTPILGEIAHATTAEPIVVTKDNRSSVAEMFRLVRTNLQFATAGKENKILLITSSMSGEGKTFFSINLAASLVLTGKKVVILGFDLRKPRLMQELNLPDGIGISNYLISDTVNVDGIIIPVENVPGLYAIGSGPIPPNPAELMLSSKVKQLLDVLKESFDHIIVDTAPVGQVADAYTLAQYVDSTLYLVRYDYTHKSQLEIVNSIYTSSKLKHPMIVLNDAIIESRYSYGYGYGYEEEPKNKWRLKRNKIEV